MNGEGGPKAPHTADRAAKQVKLHDTLPRILDALLRIEALLPAPRCPDCAGPVWDNRSKKASGKFGPKSPDFSCKTGKDKGCRGAVWLPKAES